MLSHPVELSAQSGVNTSNPLGGPAPLSVPTLLADATPGVQPTLPGPDGMHSAAVALFTQEGVPARNEPVHAVYSWENEIVTREATTDHAGKVRLTGLPPVRVILWGDRVLAGVLAADSAGNTAPLPAPYPEVAEARRAVRGGRVSPQPQPAGECLPHRRI